MMGAHGVRRGKFYYGLPRSQGRRLSGRILCMRGVPSLHIVLTFQSSKLPSNNSNNFPLTRARKLTGLAI